MKRMPRRKDVGQTMRYVQNDDAPNILAVIVVYCLCEVSPVGVMVSD